MTRERRMAIAGAVLIVLAAAALSVVNYVKGAVFWALVGAGGACFIVGVCLYGYTIRGQLKRQIRPNRGDTRQTGRSAGGSKGEE